MFALFNRLFRCVVFPGLLLVTACIGSNEPDHGLRQLDSSYVVTDSLDASKADSTFFAEVQVSNDSSVLNATGLVVYLTFDDGPHHTTPGIVRLLRKKGVKSSFFIIGSQRDRIPAYDSIYKEMEHDSLFRFYNHTYSHAITFGRLPFYYSRPDTVLADISLNRRYIPEGANHIRLPGKNTWWTSHRVRMDRLTKPVIDGLVRQGLSDRIIGWDVSWKDTNGKERVDSLMHKIVKVSKRKRPFHNHVVVLLHDYQFRNKESLADLSYFIDVLRKKHKCVFAWAEQFPQ